MSYCIQKVILLRQMGSITRTMHYNAGIIRERMQKIQIINFSEFLVPFCTIWYLFGDAFGTFAQILLAALLCNAFHNSTKTLMKNVPKSIKRTKFIYKETLNNTSKNKKNSNQSFARVRLGPSACTLHARGLGTSRAGPDRRNTGRTWVCLK